jgi:hypothetical protein
MFTKNIKDTFTASLLSAVSGVLGEAKKKPCAEGCECEACEPEETQEGYMPTNDMPSAKDRATAGKLGALLKRERDAKEKKEPNGVKTEEADMPFEKPYRKVGERKDEYGNKVKNVAKHLAKKAMKANEEVEEIEEKRGLWDNIHAKRERIKAGSGERMRKPGSKGAPSAADLKASQTEEVQIDENEQYVEITNAHTNSKSYVPVHKTQAYAALNHYNSFSHNKRVRIIDKKEHDAIHAAKAAGVKEAMDPGLEDELMSQRQGESGKKWRVERHGKTISTHSSKDEADVKAMKHPSNKVVAKESVDEAFEQIDEISKPTLGRYINKAKDSIDLTAWRQGHKEADVAANPKHVASLGKKLDKRHRGIETAVKKLTKEDAEQIDELSKDTMGRYIKKAATKIGTQGVTAGLKIAKDERSQKNFDTIGKRERGIATAVKKLTKEDAEQVDEGSYKDNPRHMGTIGPITTDAERRERAKKYREKLTKEEQDFINSLNDADMEQIDELSNRTLGSYVKKAKKQLSSSDYHVGRAVGAREAGQKSNFSPELERKLAARGKKRYDGIDKAVDKMMTKEEIEQIDEARGRPKKAGARDFTIHPKTKEKLMHNNPADMKRIERLQKNGILQKPKTEANQHIIQQLQRAKLSMRGGETVNFTHGDPTHVSGTHASKLLDKYAGMKPDEKESFQKKIGHSHANLKSEL